MKGNAFPTLSLVVRIFFDQTTLWDVLHTDATFER